MAGAQLVAIINAVAYGVIPFGLWWLIIHYPALRIKLVGLFIHMLIVCARTALRATYPASALWDWSDIHTVTAILSALCFIVGIGRVWWLRRAALVIRE